MPLFHVERYGYILDKEASEILSILEECYDRIRPVDLDFVEIVLFENDQLWRTQVTAERGRAKVASSDFDDAFIATHDAWTGIPRISIPLDRQKMLPRLVWEGALRHEAGHSILHGSLEYYMFPMPKALADIGHEFRTLTSHLTDILYLLSVAVKDMEVTRLLVSNGYVEDQVAYARFAMKPTEQDRYAWSLSTISAEAGSLFLIGRLKDIAAAAVLASDLRGPRVRLEEIEDSIEYLPRQMRTTMIGAMTKISGDLGRDTFANIQSAAGILAASLIEPIMKSRCTRQT